MKERPNAICKTLDASTAVFDRYGEDCRWRGERRGRLLRRQKRRASGASLILPNMGCTRQVFWRHLGGLYPFFSLFYSLIVFSDLYFMQLYSSFGFFYFISFSIFCSIHLHLSSTPSVTLGTDLGVAT
jgi:hypothetical protein